MIGFSENKKALRREGLAIGLSITLKTGPHPTTMPMHTHTCRLRILSGMFHRCFHVAYLFKLKKRRRADSNRCRSFLQNLALPLSHGAIL